MQKYKKNVLSLFLWLRWTVSQEGEGVRKEGSHEALVWQQVFLLLSTSFPKKFKFGLALVLFSTSQPDFEKGFKFGLETGFSPPLNLILKKVQIWSGNRFFLFKCSDVVKSITARSDQRVFPRRS